jgi:hypothetical protein
MFGVPDYEARKTESSDGLPVYAQSRAPKHLHTWSQLSALELQPRGEHSAWLCLATGNIKLYDVADTTSTAPDPGQHPMW